MNKSFQTLETKLAENRIVLQQRMMENCKNVEHKLTQNFEGNITVTPSEKQAIR